MRIEIDAELVQTQENTAVLRLKTGFGDPELHVDQGRYRVVADDDYARLPRTFAAAMEAQLRANAHKGGRGHWLADGPKALLKRLKEEVLELEDAVRYYPDQVLAEAADVANFALMVADKADALEPPTAAELAAHEPAEG